MEVRTGGPQTEGGTAGFHDAKQSVERGGGIGWATLGKDYDDDDDKYGYDYDYEFYDVDDTV